MRSLRSPKVASTRSASLIRRYTVAALCVLIPFAFRYVLHPILGPHAVYVVFVPGIMLAAWCVGFGPALFSTAIAFVLANNFLVPPVNGWTRLNWFHAAAGTVYLFCVFFVVGFVNALRREQERVQSKARENERRNDQLQREIERRKLAEESLRSSEKQFRVLTETAVDAVISVDSAGTIILLNTAAEKMFGYSAADLIGQPITVLMPESFRTLCITSLKRFLETGQSQMIGHTRELVGLRRDGHEFPLELALSAWETAEGKFFTAILRDITERKQAEETLRRSEEMLRMTTEGGRIGLWSWDIAADTLKWNRIEYEQFGLPPDTDLSVETFINCIHPDDRRFVDEQIAKCLREGCELNFEHRILHADGSVRWNQCKGQVIYENGRPAHLSGIALDITERKEAQEKLERSEQSLRFATEATGVGLWDWNLETDEMEWTPLAYKLLGLPNGTEKSYERALIATHPDDRERADRTVKRSIASSIPFDLETRVFWPDGSIHWLWIKGHPIKDTRGQAIRFIGMGMEITDRKLSQAALEEATAAMTRHAEELEFRVARRTAELQASLKDMESFCYTIAHDLRAPLRAMSGFSRALQQDYGDNIDETGREYCRRIHKAAEHMNSLISDLLAYGRLSHAALPVQAVNLTDEIDKVLQRTAPEIEERGAHIEVEKPLPIVVADPPVLDQVLQNLISNAVKFVPAGREPRVHIYAEHYHDRVRLCVEDNGIGIEPQHRGRIFRPFERLHTVEAYPGTGIGLAIVQKGIEKMGGEVGVEAAPREGSRFWVELPEYHASSASG